MLSGGARRAVRAWTVLILLFLYVPLALVLVNAFNSSRTFAFPPTGLTVQWWLHAANSEGMWKSLANSVVVGLGATMIALVLGTMAAFAVQRYDFFGKHTVSFLVVLPITLPGIVTGIALNATFTSALGVTLGLATVIIGHATFCIVIVFNNTQARLRRLGSNLEDASADLGASERQTFRYVTFPMMRGALVAGAILAFALSFDRADTADLDLRKSVPAEPGSGDQCRRRRTDPDCDHPRLARSAVRRRSGRDAGVGRYCCAFGSHCPLVRIPVV